MVDDAMDFLDFEPTGFTRRPIHVRIVSRRNAPANGAVDEEDAMMRYTVTAALLALAAWCAYIAVRNYRRQRATRNYERDEAHAALLSRAWDFGFRNAVMAELRPSDIDVVIERLLSDDDALEWPVPNDWTPPYGIDRPEQ